MVGDLYKYDLFQFNSFLSNLQVFVDSLLYQNHCSRSIGNIVGHINKNNRRISAQLVLNKTQLWPKTCQPSYCLSFGPNSKLCKGYLIPIFSLGWIVKSSDRGAPLAKTKINPGSSKFSCITLKLYKVKFPQVFNLCQIWSVNHQIHIQFWNDLYLEEFLRSLMTPPPHEWKLQDNISIAQKLWIMSRRKARSCGEEEHCQESWLWSWVLEATGERFTGPLDSLFLPANIFQVTLFLSRKIYSLGNKWAY